VTVRHRRRDWLYRASMLATDTVISVSRASCEAALAQHLVPAAKAVAIPNGIPIGDFRPRSDEARRRLAGTLGLAQDTALLGTVGRLHPAKDHALLLRAFAQLVTDHPQTALVIVGDGALRADLERDAHALGVADQVRFLGDRSDVKALLCAFDLFVMSSRTEGYSIALVEACAAALPIVATAVGGNPEIVEDGRNGRIVPPGDASALVAAIAGLLDDAPRREAMGEAARQWALANGSVEAMAERYQTVYRGTRPPDAAAAAR
jgi:glycosyltransferase involved in cell wall biosynthesis